MSTHGRRGTAAAIGLCVSVVTGGLVLGQDKPPTPDRGGKQSQAGEARYDLRANYPFRLGEKVRVVDGARHEGLVNVLRRGKPLRVENRRGGYELRYTDEVQGVAPRGGVTRVLRTYERVKDWATGQEDRTPRTAVLDYTGEALSVTRKDDLSPVADRLLTTETKVPFSALDQMIPALGPVPVGTRWTIPNGPAAQIFLLDPANLADGSECSGVLHSVRTQKGVEQVRVVVTFDLRVKKIYDITFDEPATLACTLDLWSTANGAAPGASGTFTGSMKGEGSVEGAPEDVSVQLTVTVTGTIQQELLATTR